MTVSLTIIFVLQLSGSHEWALIKDDEIHENLIEQLLIHVEYNKKLVLGQKIFLLSDGFFKFTGIAVHNVVH